MRRKLGFYFSVQWKIIKELFSMDTLKTVVILVLSFIMMLQQIVELKFLEYASNNAYRYFRSEGAVFRDILLHTAGFLGMLLIIRITGCIYRLFVEKYESAVVFASEKKLMKKLPSISYEHYESSEFYEQVNLARQASGQYSQAVYGITQIMNILFMMVMYGVLLSRMNGLYVILIFLSTIISVLLSTRVTDKQLDYWRVHVSPDERRSEYFHDVFRNKVNHQNIQTNRSFPYFGQKYGYYKERERKNYLRLNLYSFSTELFSCAAFLVSYLLAAVFVGKGITEGRYEIGYYSIVIALLANMFDTIKRFVQFMLRNNWYVRVLDAYFKILEISEDGDGCSGQESDKPEDEMEGARIHGTGGQKTEIQESGQQGIGRQETVMRETGQRGIDNQGVNRQGVTIQSFGLLVLRDVRYQYVQAQDYALKGVDCSFHKGHKVAIVGENGSGKSTMMSIILGLLKDYQGEYQQADVMKTAILQDFIQYQMSVKENIEIGCGGRSLPEEKIVEILKKVGLYNFICTKPEGIHTKLGQLEDGIELSKGQWQRLAIARLLAQEQAEIWILDEPTAYLDPIAEIEMYDFIFQLAGERLVFFISHRLGFAKKADRIVVVDQGRIAEEGTHRELMQNEKRIYARMYQLQRGWYA